MNLVEKITKEQIRTDLPNFQVGDTIRVDLKIVEGKTHRIQDAGRDGWHSYSTCHSQEIS